MNNKRFMLGSTLVLVLLIVLFIKIPAIQVSYENGSFYIEENSFEIGWIHSVEKEPWYETYKKKDNHLLLEKTRFKTFGAGTPSTGEVVPSKDGFIHMKMNQEMEAIHLSVSQNVQTTLYTENQTIPLYKLVEDYETVTIEVEKRALWQLIRGEKQ